MCTSNTNIILKMWKTRLERMVSDNETARVYTNEETTEDRSLPRSYHGSFSGVEFDVEAGPVSDRDSEKDHDSVLSIDWVAQALRIRERLLKEEPKEASGETVIEKQRTPSPDYENVDYEDLPKPNKRRILKKNADTYEMEKYKRNAMIIFNHKDFLSGCKKTREGTMHDENSLKVTFEKFGFEVETHLDLPKKRLLQELKNFCSKDFTEHGCVCVAIMTHGSKHGYLRAYDTRYSEHEVIECLNVRRNPTLLGKPIIILIQACRGDEPATAVNPDTPKLGDVELDNDDHYNLPTEADMLIFHSSYIGRASARETRKGSWFVQTLCEQIAILASLEDFESICRAVKKDVAQEKEQNMFFNNKLLIAKQMPVMTSTLMRLLYLRKYEGDHGENNEGDSLVRFSCEYGIRKYENDFILQNDTVCSCDEYFEYVKKCLRLFIVENPDDEVASSILKIAGKVRIHNENKYVQIDMINLIIQYLSRKANRFTFSEVVYLGQPCCCSRRRRREQKMMCCSVC